jgi:hypothetical protein
MNWQGTNARKAVERAVTRGMLRTMSDCVYFAKGEVPVNYGTLQGSIELRPPYRRGNVFIGIWGSFNVNYALWVEIGTGPHFPPLDPLRDWARHKLGAPEAAFPIALKIAESGTKEQPYLRPAADAHYRDLAGNIRRAA